jgi:hypothetical protein
VREGADVSIEKTDLVLALVDPSKVAAGIHQPHQEEPRLAARAVQIDEHLEEVDLREITRPIRQRHEDLASLPFQLRDRFFDEGDADTMALGNEQLMEPRGRELLLPARPPRRLGQQGFDPRAHRSPDRSSSRRRLLPDRHRFLYVLPDGTP